MSGVAAVLAEAAACYAAGAAPRGAEAAQLLDALGYVPGGDGPLAANRTALLRLAARMERSFRIASPGAPGLAGFGAQLRGEGWLLNASGAGLTLREAFEGCMGEAAEFLSQWERPGDIACTATLHEVAARLDEAEREGVAERLRAAGLPLETALDWVAGMRLHDGQSVLLPADFVLRRPAGRGVLDVDGKASLGCGAGRSLEQAIGHGMLEAVERDAAALWWRGGVRGHALPLERAVLDGPMRLLEQLRQGHAARATWLLDITSDTGIPCVAALSCDGDGFGLACGIGARASLAEAAQAALRELCQMELAGGIVAARLRARGPEGLTGTDRAALARLTQVDTRDCALLHPLPQPRAPAAAPDPGGIAAALARRGHAACAATLTRADIGIPAAIVRVPGLEREPGLHSGARLLQAIATTGGSALYSAGVTLM